MRKYYIFIILLGILVLILLEQGFSLLNFTEGLPKDIVRLSDFNQIKIKIENYFGSYNKLPSSLLELKEKNGNLSIVDSFSKKQYAYQVISVTDYKLCTEFSNSSSTYEKYLVGEHKFEKGYF